MNTFEDLIAEMEEYGRSNHVPIINEKGMPVLLEVVRQKKPHRVLEIGTAIGYSALLIANNSADDVEIDTLELSQERAATARAYIDRTVYKDCIRIHVGDAGENI
ncbi:MAG TPA: O-methyltransferase, partial [Anaerovibrio sp.]|nr:O-methyltransferase [Anaerovibrio sp.]